MTRSVSLFHEEEMPYGANEVDDFAAKREKVLLEDADVSEKQNEEDDQFMVDESDEIMELSEELSSEEESLDGEKAYKKVFGRKLNVGEDLDDSGSEDDKQDCWGSSKNEYYGADDLENDEVAKEVEKEALQRQRKHLEELQMDDYLEEELEKEWMKEAKEFDVEQFQKSGNGSCTTIAIRDTLDMDVEAKEKFVKTFFPEFIPLANEFQKMYAELRILRARDPGKVKDIELLACLAYLGAISSYFAIFLHELKSNEEFNTLKDHPVMECILTNKEIWRKVRLLSGATTNGHSVDKQELGGEVIGQIEGGVSSEEDEQSRSDLECKVQFEDEEVGDVFDIDVTKPRINSSRSSMVSENDIDDYMESDIAEVDAQEKKSRKRTLRFYTSKINQQGNKSDKFKGDDDIPYKERLYERQQRLIEEACKRGARGAHGDELQDDYYNSEDERISRTVNKASEEDYYQLIKKTKAYKKESRFKAHNDAIKASRDNKLSELLEKVGDDGKRAINYQILKNKGLTPKRKKDNRNSRVKKRKKYEKTQKKLKSVRAVYSGGQNGVYEGEKTGIRKNLTKSVKFKS